MCHAFSLIIDKKGKTYWKAGLDSHEDIIKEFKLKEPKGMPQPPTNEWLAKHLAWAKLEIVPKDGNYIKDLEKDAWELKVDEPIRPDWYHVGFEKLGWKAWKGWKEQIYSQINIKEARNPIHPFKIKGQKEITKEDLKLLKNWDSVRDSVRDSVWDSVGASVWDSVWDSVRDSVRDSVGASVWDSVWDSVRASVWAYYGSLFPGIKTWKYVDKKKPCFKGLKYPFQSAMTLWKKGLVPAYDGKVWKLYGSPKGDGKCEVLWEGKI